MTQTSNSTTRPRSSLVIRMAVGAIIGFLVISFFVFGFEPYPEFGKYWRIRPLIVTPLVGALGGLSNYFILNFCGRIGMNKIVAVIISVIVFIISLWMGIILGLADTLWD